MKQVFKNTLILAIVFSGAFFVLSAWNRPGNQTGAQTPPNPLTGWAWSNVGWISLHDTGSAPAWGVTENNGTLAGYAWSDQIGWITFNQSELSGCPSGPCKAEVDSATGNFSGWARACGVFNTNTCSGTLHNSEQLGGWDGWISLAGSGYGVSRNTGTGTVTGYAWGGPEFLGWVEFSGQLAGTSACAPGFTLINGVCVGNVNPPPSCPGCPTLSLAITDTNGAFKEPDGNAYVDLTWTSSNLSNLACATSVSNFSVTGWGGGATVTPPSGGTESNVAINSPSIGDSGSFTIECYDDNQSNTPYSATVSTVVSGPTASINCSYNSSTQELTWQTAYVENCTPDETAPITITTLPATENISCTEIGTGTPINKTCTVNPDGTTSTTTTPVFEEI